MAASVCELPSRQWEGLWDSLIFPDDTKTKLLDYIYATVLFSDANVDCKLWLTAPDALTQCIYSQHRIMESRRTSTWATWNRKNFTLQSSRPKALYTTVTSVCTHIAPFGFFFYPLLIARSYPHSRLLEINSHSLFSRWFSESGKLVQKLFGSVMDLVEDEDTFVVVLIGTFLACTVAIFVSSYKFPLADEVESLTAARAGAMAGTEPTDSLRVNPHHFSSRHPIVEHRSIGRECPTYSTRQAST
jgi:hypothetical protein